MPEFILLFDPKCAHCVRIDQARWTAVCRYFVADALFDLDDMLWQLMLLVMIGTVRTNLHFDVCPVNRQLDYEMREVAFANLVAASSIGSPAVLYFVPFYRPDAAGVVLR